MSDDAPDAGRGVHHESLFSRLDHARHESLYAVRDAPYVDPVDPFEIAGFSVPQVEVGNRHACVVAQDVTSAVGVEYMVGQGLHRGGISYVGHHAGDRPTQFFAGILECRLFDVANHDLHAFG